MAFLLQDGNLLFTGALLLMLMIALLEGIMTLIGVGISDLVDNLLPEIEIDANMPDTGLSGGLTRLLGWMRFGEVPALILLVAFLVAFGVSGLIIQYSADALLGAILPGWLLVLPVLLLALPQVRLLANLMRRMGMGDESEAIRRDSFSGRVAVITVGEAKAGSPAEARFSDEFGTNHYVMVEPDEGETFKQGDRVLLVEERGTAFRIVRPAR